MVNGELMFTAGGHRSKAISWPELVRNATNQKTIEDNDLLDVLFIIDSCYSGCATRKLKDATERIVEVVAAVNSSGTALGNDPSNPRTQARTFTSKLADYIAHLKGQNADSIDFSVAIAKLVAESPLKKPTVPTHELLMGAFPQTVPATDTELRAVVRVHLTPTLTSEDASALRHWPGSLDGRYKLTLEGVYEADSTVVLMTMGHSLFLKMTNHAIELVALVKSHNLLRP